MIHTLGRYPFGNQALFYGRPMTRNESGSKVIVFGASGRVGRAVVAEARARGYEVTEAGRGEGDVTSAADVARLAAGHDAAVVAVYDAQAAPGVFFPAVARALAAGLGEAGVGRLLSVGLASVLATRSGAALMDTPGYPQEWREFYVGHGAGTDALRAAAAGGAGLGGAEPGRGLRSRRGAGRWLRVRPGRRHAAGSRTPTSPGRYWTRSGPRRSTAPTRG